MATNKNIEDSELLDDFHLNEDDLTDEAKRLFPFHTEIIQGLNFAGHSALNNNFLSSGGRHIICSKLMRSHNNVKNILNYLAVKPLETKQKINDVPMIVICGLPRTGTTLLHNLMGCDPLCRAPLLTDMTMQPIPPIPRSNIDEHKRRAKTETDIEAKVFKTAQYDIKKFQKKYSSSHAMFPIEEDVFLLGDVGISAIYTILAPKETNFSKWYFNVDNKDFAYKYHQTVLQMLHNVDPPQTHWQLKSAIHTYYIDTFLKYYPQASLIITHRRIDQVLPSLYKFWFSALAPYFNEDEFIHLKAILDQTIPLSVDIRIDHLLNFRSRDLLSKNVLDVRYEDLMKDPIGTVHRIYDHFPFLKWSNEFEEAMRKWLIDNPQGKQGRHSYSLSEFNLEDQMDKQLYRDYEKMFL